MGSDRPCAEPYAIVDMETKSKAVPILQQRTDNMKLSNNPSYSSNIFMLASESHASASQSLDDLRIELPLGYRHDEKKTHTPAGESDVTVSRLLENYTTSGGDKLDCEVENYSKQDGMGKEDGRDGIHIYDQPIHHKPQ